MSGAGRHRDKGYAKWWIWLAVVFAVAVGIIYLVPFIFSPQPEEALNTAPASITEAERTANNDSEQRSEAQTGQLTGNAPVTEDPPLGEEGPTSSQ